MTGIIILAAGSSSRLGTPKQNLLFKGKTLLQNALDAALELNIGPVVLVLGANSKIILSEIDTTTVIIVHNENWGQGMSTSIHLGVTELQKHQDIHDAIIMLCDQPFVDSGLLNRMVQMRDESRKGIVACTYNNALGVPALFTTKYFTNLLNLQGQEGAKKLLSKFKDDTAVVDFASGAVDVDTVKQYQQLLSLDKNKQQKTI